MRIFSIELENFRMFEKKRVEFPAMFSVLIGENGTGKSAILEALSICLDRNLVGPFGKQVGNDELGNPSLVNRKIFRYWTDEFQSIVRSRNLIQRFEFQLPNGNRRDCEIEYAVGKDDQKKNRNFYSNGSHLLL
ncbi:MAG: AAA family ATPase [Bacteroidetes bacterium]|nr:AAA family ATPase [Bacteroidota bacterium]